MHHCQDVVTRHVLNTYLAGDHCCSIYENKLGPAGWQALTKALRTNTALCVLQYVAHTHAMPHACCHAACYSCCVLCRRTCKPVLYCTLNVGSNRNGCVMLTWDHAVLCRQCLVRFVFVASRGANFQIGLHWWTGPVPTLTAASSLPTNGVRRMRLKR